MGERALGTNFSAYQFIEYVHSIIAETAQANSRLLIVGGTLFYLKALETGLPPLKSSAQLRAQLENECRQFGLTSLLSELDRKDPETGQTIDRNNPRRVVRALELIRQYQLPLQKVYAHASVQHPPLQLLKIALIPRKKALVEAITARAEALFHSAGILKEVRKILASGISKATLLQHKAIGYRETVEWLSGLCTQAEALAQTIQRTKRLAKHQLTWLKRQTQTHFIFIDSVQASAQQQSLTEAWALHPDTIKIQNYCHFAATHQAAETVAQNLCSKFYANN